MDSEAPAGVPAQPNRMLGVLGSHGSGGGSGEGDPVQALAYCAQRQLLASAGLDDTVGSTAQSQVLAQQSATCIDEANRRMPSASMAIATGTFLNVIMHGYNPHKAHACRAACYAQQARLLPAQLLLKAICITLLHIMAVTRVHHLKHMCCHAGAALGIGRGQQRGRRRGRRGLSGGDCRRWSDC